MSGELIHSKWMENARDDAIRLLEDAIRELKEHPELFAEYGLSLSSASEYPQRRSITVVFEVPQE